MFQRVKGGYDMKFKPVIALFPLIVITMALVAAPLAWAAGQGTGKQPGKQTAKSKTAKSKSTQKQAAKKAEPIQPPAEHTGAEHKAAVAGEVERVTVDELKARLEKNEPVTILDVRSEGSYESSDKKIKGAVRMLTDEIGSRLKEIPRDAMIVTYCT
jgi:hypothetical protein